VTGGSSLWLSAGLWLGAGLAVAGLAVLLIAFATTYLTVHPIWWVRRPTAPRGERRPEAVRFPSEDGTGLAGWHVDRGAGATIILCHGWPGSKDDMRGLGESLARCGFNVLAFDFRGWGGSDPGPVTLGYREALDVAGAVRFVTAQQGGPAQRIGVFGLSMGAAAAILAAAARPEIGAVVADSSYARLDHAVRHIYGGLWGAAAPLFYAPTCWLGEHLMGTALRDVSPLGAIGQIQPRPLLLIHGAQDRLIDPSDAQALLRRAGDPKDLWLVEGADHAEARPTAAGEYDARVAGFFRQHLGGRR